MADTSHTENIVCPHCKYEDTDSWESQADEGYEDCGECGQEFWYSRHVQITYSTSIPEKSSAERRVELAERNQRFIADFQAYTAARGVSNG